MEAFPDIAPLWDLSQASSFSQLPDDDFLALLQKQFPSSNTAPTYNAGGFVDGVNPQNISRYSLPSITPPSEDSSPSPPNITNDSNGRNLAQGNYEDPADPALKRKASAEDFEEGPSQKNQHTSSNNKKGSIQSSRRKSSGGGPDDNRLLKRKEQNRAAQRAFRERKEKHVKDLEDKIAALQAKNDQATSENENLRDLLSRLQNENVVLKQSSFTFTVPKTAGPSETDGASASSSVPTALFPSVSQSTVAPPPASPRASPAPANVPLDWDSLTTFDPAILSLLDDNPQPTATDGAMQMDFGFGENTGLSSNTPLTTIASNPMFTSFASAFDTASPSSSATDRGQFGFDMTSLSPWPTPSASSQDTGSLDDLFGGYLSSQAPIDYNVLLASPPSAISPLSHANGRSPANSVSSSSPASSISAPSMFNSPRDSSVSDSDGCPKTKAALAKKIELQGPSPFAPPPGVQKSAEGNSVSCNGSNFPKTVESDQNVEVLSAWRSITSNPKFKDVDINDLCNEFTSKARCDGKKVVLEPQGVHHILDKLSSKH